jgi:hypothetical protein
MSTHWFVVSLRHAFFATPDSGMSVDRPRGGDDEYAMHPEEVRGSWIVDAGAARRSVRQLRRPGFRAAADPTSVDPVSRRSRPA